MFPKPVSGLEEMVPVLWVTQDTAHNLSSQ